MKYLLVFVVMPLFAADIQVYSSTIQSANCAVPVTGQTNVYAVGDDGYYRAGRAWPDPRFTIGTDASSNCVTDNMTGLMWLKNPGVVGSGNWTNMLAVIEALDGNAGRGGYTDWRMANFNELASLANSRTNAYPAIPASPFLSAGAVSWLYQSSTTVFDNALRAISFNVGDGRTTSYVVKESINAPAFPVRGP
jgi:hypothetical protein